MTRKDNHFFALAAALALLSSNFAEAENCHDEIARVQQLIDKSRAGAAEIPGPAQIQFRHHAPPADARKRGPGQG